MHTIFIRYIRKRCKSPKTNNTNNGVLWLGILLMIESCITLRPLNYGNYGIFLMSNAGFISSTVASLVPPYPVFKLFGFLLFSSNLTV